jgi:ubiquinone/menaquinone biosynthesis C-methylase UbiE
MVCGKRGADGYLRGNMKSTLAGLKKMVPTPVRSRLKQTYYGTLDFAESLLGLRDSMTPPRKKIFVGAGDFKKIGNEFCQYLVEFGELGRDDKVLDLGCGIGRIAIPLTRYLSSRATYHGIDVVPDGVEWAQQHISKKFQNFHFQCADIYNASYNPKGRNRGDQYRLPFQDGYFDFIFMTSVFTHMLRPDVENYLREAVRVLAAGGRCFSTYFLLNDASLNLIKAGSSSHDFPYEIDGCRTVDKERPTMATAYDESYMTRATYAVFTPALIFRSWSPSDLASGLEGRMVCRSRISLWQ